MCAGLPCAWGWLSLLGLWPVFSPVQEVFSVGGLHKPTCITLPEPGTVFEIGRSDAAFSAGPVP